MALARMNRPASTGFAPAAAAGGRRAARRWLAEAAGAAAAPVAPTFGLPMMFAIATLALASLAFVPAEAARPQATWEVAAGWGMFGLLAAGTLASWVGVARGKRFG